MNEYKTTSKKKNSSSIFVTPIASIILACLLFMFLAWQTIETERSQRLQLISMTNSFVSTFSEHRGKGSPVPATFRRLGIEKFSDSSTFGEEVVPKNVRMPGRPGLELEIVEHDPRISEIISEMVDTDARKASHEYKFENGKVIGRTISPSVAGSESCVACHNKELGKEAYALNDIMGAFVVESDLTDVIARNAYYAAGSFLFFLAVLSILSHREQRRAGKITDLESQVGLEKIKLSAAERERFILSHDSLTQIPNRSMFKERLEEELNSDSKDDLFVGLVDLDDFKPINDTMGHAAGDALLIEIANRMSSVVELGRGLISRLGGDEFAFVVRRNATYPNPETIGGALLDKLKPEFYFEGNEIQPKCSIGIVSKSPYETIYSVDIMKAADEALYSAKEIGKNCVRIYDESIKRNFNRNQQISHYLPEAIRKQEIQVAYQPKICLKTGKIVGFEALARWSLFDEDISPSEFIPIAEKVGLVKGLDYAVLENAAKFSAHIEKTLGLAVPINSNISARHLNSKAIAKDIKKILDRTGLKPEALTVEITEGYDIRDWDQALDVLESLKLIGVRVSLDDFGTGYTSLKYLRQFKFDEIKIDQSFIKDIESNNENYLILKNTINLIRALDISVVVEGIETKEHSDLIAELGANIGQGFYFSKPIKPEVAEMLLSQNLVAFAA